MNKAFCTLIAFCVLTSLAGAASPIRFEDVTARVGLADPLKKWELSHAGAWGDVDGDNLPDLYLGAFADRPVYKLPDAPIPDMLFLSKKTSFSLSPETSVRFQGKFARTTSAVFVDADNDGDLDLFVGNNAPKEEQVQCTLFENDGKGGFKDVTPPTPPWPRPLAVRNISAWDIDMDGLLDLVFTDGNYGNWGGGGGRIIALRHKGKWQFEDISREYTFPDKEAAGMGLAIGDVNDDGRFDVFLADENRMFVTGPGGKLHEIQPGTFVKPERGKKEAHACGAAFGDLNGDNLLDLVTTEHGQPCNIHVYMNRGIKGGNPEFTEATAACNVNQTIPKTGVTGQPLKTAHVSLQDFDNDGRVDIYLPILMKGTDGTLQPLVLRNEGNNGSTPRFEPIPTDRLIVYYAPGPATDYDRDGKIDVFLPTWFTNAPSVLFRNVSEGNQHWLTVRVRGEQAPFNSMGIGATVRLFAAGGAGDPKQFLGRRDISVGNGYSSGEEALGFFGLGSTAKCDIEASWFGRKRILRDVSADQLLTISFPAISP